MLSRFSAAATGLTAVDARFLGPHGILTQVSEEGRIFVPILGRTLLRLRGVKRVTADCTACWVVGLGFVRSPGSKVSGLIRHPPPHRSPNRAASASSREALSTLVIVLDGSAALAGGCSRLSSVDSGHPGCVAVFCFLWWWWVWFVRLFVLFIFLIISVFILIDV